MRNFLDFLDRSTLTREEARAVLDEIELANFRIHGYGSAAFTWNLRLCYERLAERHIDEAALQTVMALGERIVSQPIELIDGVAELLPTLATRHDLTLMTKGHPEEQQLKIDRSGLGEYFRHAAVVPEKDAAAYLVLVEELRLDPRRTWMIGNSPKSDINPALAAGINAVFIPHSLTWRLEHQEIDADAGQGRLLTLERFRDLATHF